jgi:hypothetical protein
MTRIARDHALDARGLATTGSPMPVCDSPRARPRHGAAIEQVFASVPLPDPNASCAARVGMIGPAV